MTRKDYVRLSSAFGAFRKAVINAPDATVGIVAGFDLAVRVAGKALAHNNPKFDRALFLKDSGL